MPLLPLGINSKKLFLPNFPQNFAVRVGAAVTFVTTNGIFFYDFLKHRNDMIPILYISILSNLIFLAMWSLAYILARRMAPYIQVEGKHIEFCHRNISKDFEIEEIDHIKIGCERYLGAGGVTVERRIYVVQKNGDHTQVHENFFGPMKKVYESFSIELEKISGKPVITEESQTC